MSASSMALAPTAEAGIIGWNSDQSVMPASTLMGVVHAVLHALLALVLAPFAIIDLVWEWGPVVARFVWNAILVVGAVIFVVIVIAMILFTLGAGLLYVVMESEKLGVPPAIGVTGDSLESTAERGLYTCTNSSLGGESWRTTRRRR